MSTDPNEIREDIERTRRELGDDVDALAEKVTPSKIVHRQTDKVKSAIGSAKDRVFGVASDAKGSVSGTVSSAGSTLTEVPHKAINSAKGNPMAVGLIAFGVGMLVASLIPASEKEKGLSETLKEKAQPLAAELTDAAKHVAEDLKEPAQEAMDSVKSAATDGMDTVKQEGASAAGGLKDEAKDAGQGMSSPGSPTW
ncbi:MAG: hypothetical protein JWP30_65 [Homoserinimonas sp.]|jgi:ElaB/YqjD/DUF883 family membrane-anchored ribosome-binding protein|nr:hypothetical protein [Homoserinimonas sp.]